MKHIAYMNGVTWETEFLHLKELLHTYSQNTYILIASKQLYFWISFKFVNTVLIFAVRFNFSAHLCSCLNANFATGHTCIIKLQIAQLKVI